jgi:hypothetical protein
MVGAEPQLWRGRSSTHSEGIVVRYGLQPHCGCSCAGCLQHAGEQESAHALRHAQAAQDEDQRVQYVTVEKAGLT